MKKITSLLLIAGLLFATFSFGGCSDSEEVPDDALANSVENSEYFDADEGNASEEVSDDVPSCSVENSEYLDTDEGNASKEVPDDVLARFVEDSEYYDTDYELSWTARHSVSESSNVDVVHIKLFAKSTYGSYYTTTLAVYEYNRTSVLWTLVEAAEWSERFYTLNNNILGMWDIGSAFETGGNKSYTIRVTDLVDQSIAVDYAFIEDVYGDGYAVFDVAGSYTAEFSSNYFRIPITLPEHFYADGKGLDASKTVDLVVYFSIDEGLTGAIFSGQIFYVE